MFMRHVYLPKTTHINLRNGYAVISVRISCMKEKVPVQMAVLMEFWSSIRFLNRMKEVV